MRIVLGATMALLCASRAQAEKPTCPPIADVSKLLGCARSSGELLLRSTARVEAARARREAAGRWLPSNPVIDLSVGRRADAGETWLDRSAELAQTIELGGQRGARVSAAEADLRAAEAGVSLAAAELEGAVLGAAAEVVRARGLLALAREQREAAAKLEAASLSRTQKGLAAPIEEELAQAAMVQALREERQATEALALAELELSAVVGQEVKLAEGAALPSPSSAWRTLPELERAAQARPEVIDALAEAAAARARVELLRQERIPNLTVAAGYRHEQQADIVGGRVSLPLPLFQRNGPEIAEAQAAVSAADGRVRISGLRAGLQLRAAFSSAERARALAARFGPSLESKLREDATAVQAAYERGALVLTQALAALRETQAARRSLLEARADVVRATLDLARAAGLSPCLDGACR